MTPLPAGLEWRSEWAALQQEGAQGSGETRKTRPSPTGVGSGEQGTGEQQQQQPGGAKQPCGGDMFIWLPVIFLLMWLLLIRPQRKQEKARKAMNEAVKKGDKVVTNSGMRGTVTRTTDDTVVLKLEPEGLKVTFERSAIRRILMDDQADAK